MTTDPATWQITSIDTPSGQDVVLFSNPNDGELITSPGAILSGSYILSFPGLGYIQMVDKSDCESTYSSLSLTSSTHYLRLCTTNSFLKLHGAISSMPIVIQFFNSVTDPSYGLSEA